MDQVLLSVNKVKCYLDDIIISAKNRKECEEKIVLKRLNDHNIRIIVEKCKFFVNEVNFLGHTISSTISKSVTY